MLEWDYPKVCVNLQIDVRLNDSVWRFYYGKKTKLYTEDVATNVIRRYA